MVSRTAFALTFLKVFSDKRSGAGTRQSSVCAYVHRCSALILACSALLIAEPMDRVETLIQQVEKHYNSAKTLAVDFTESYSILGHGRPSESGTLTLRKAGKMRWDYRQPQGKLFVSDGKTVFLYTARDNRVEKVSLKATDDMRAPLAFLLGKLDMKKEFRKISTREAANGWWLDAESKTDRLPYRSIEMLVSDSGQVKDLIVHGQDESVTSYRFTNEKVNPTVDDGLFRFQIPAGAQVVDALEARNGDGQ